MPSALMKLLGDEKLVTFSKEADRTLESVMNSI